MELLFDLDGTLTDPVSGITRSMQHALGTLGRPVPDTAALACHIGPPLRASFAQLLGSDDAALIAQAVALYRQRFSEIGLYENSVYPAVPRALAALVEAGHRLWVVTSKPHVYARRIIEHFGLRGWFTDIYGSELDGRNTEKVDLIRVVLDNERLAPAQTWMIGDRDLDVRGGRQNGTHTAGVLWGYGSEAELRAAGPDLLLDRIEGLLQHLSARNYADILAGRAVAAGAPEKPTGVPAGTG
jgi:phosphoglycolate phosphatase